MAFHITDQLIGSQSIAETSSTKKHPLGNIVKADDPSYGVGEFIYLQGAASTAVGSIVSYNQDDFSSTLATANDKGSIAIAMSANVASQYGWYQIKGKGIAKVLAGFADNADCYLTATAGSVDDAVVSGDLIYGMKGASAIDTPSTGLAEVEIDYPQTRDGDILDSTAITATSAELNYLDIASLGAGAASKAVVLDANGAYVGPTGASAKFTWSVTSDSTDAGTSVEPFVHNTTMTGAGGVGGRARFELDTNVALGGWANALKAQTQFGAAGSVTGLGSSIVAEMILSAGTASGSYAPLEIELGLATGALTGTRTSFISFNVYGADAGTMDNSGFLFDLNGVTAGSGDLFASNAKTGIGMTHTLKCQILGTTYFIALHTSADFGGS